MIIIVKKSDSFINKEPFDNKVQRKKHVQLDRWKTS